MFLRHGLKTDQVPMKIAFISPEYPHEKTTVAAGIGTSIKNLAVELVRNNCDVTLFVYGQRTTEIFEDQGIHIHLIKKKKYVFASWFLYRKFLQHYINHAIQTQQIDIVEAPDWTGITAFMKLKAPLVIRLHGSDAYFCRLENRKQKRKNFIFEKLAVRNADALVSPTDFAAKLSATVFGLGPATIRTIPNGISLRDFENPSPQNFEAGLIVYVGTLIRKKGVLELPAIMQEVLKYRPNSRLVLIGSDSSDKQTASPSTWRLIEKQLSGELETQIEYAGKKPYAEVIGYLEKANLCVFPTFAETLGMVTIEAMAMQKAVVSSDFGWVTEIIEHGKNGYLANPKDHRGFAQLIVKLLEDNELVLQMGNSARERVAQKFDIEKIAVATISFYKSVLSQ
jgi:glycosyltransferase involved in cell wall biosynthesis